MKALIFTTATILFTGLNLIANAGSVERLSKTKKTTNATQKVVVKPIENLKNIEQTNPEELPKDNGTLGYHPMKFGL